MFPNGELHACVVTSFILFLSIFLFFVHLFFCLCCGYDFSSMFCVCFVFVLSSFLSRVHYVVHMNPHLLPVSLKICSFHRNPITFGQNVNLYNYCKHHYKTTVMTYAKFHHSHCVAVWSWAKWYSINIWFVLNCQWNWSIHDIMKT